MPGVIFTSTKAVALPTSANGINDEGRLVGFYVDANGNTDGFVATRHPSPLRWSYSAPS